MEEMAKGEIEASTKNVVPAINLPSTWDWVDSSPAGGSCEGSGW